jgi:hypothetical protein
MADSDVIRKLEIYRALYRMNRAFAHLSRSLEWLTANRIPEETDVPEAWGAQLGEVQSEINRRLTENLHNLEHGDVMRLGRIVAMAPQVRALYLEQRRPEHRTPRKKPRK